MAVYTQLLYAGGASSSSTTFYTVPSGATVVIRDVEGRNLGSAVDDLIIGWTALPVNNGYFLPCNAVPGLAARQWEGRVAVPAGGVLAVATNGQSWEVVITAYVLS